MHIQGILWSGLLLPIEESCNNENNPDFNFPFNNGEHRHQVNIDHGHTLSLSDLTHNHTLNNKEHTHSNTNHQHDINNEPEYYSLAFIYLKGGQ